MKRRRRRRRKVFVREVRERNESRVSRSNVSARLQRQIWQCDLRPAANEASLIISSSYLAGDSDALCRARVAPSAGSMSDMTTTTIEGFTRDGHDTLSTTTLCARSLLPRLYYRKYTLSSLSLSFFLPFSFSFPLFLCCYFPLQRCAITVSCDDNTFTSTIVVPLSPSN